MRLLSWNINRFTRNNIWKVDRRVDDFDLWLDNYDWSMLNKNYILDTVRRADPTVFVVIETQSSAGLVGTLIDGGGKDGSLYLLDILRVGISDQWCLVPPTRIAPMINETDDEVIADNAYTEGISVYYRRDRVDFQGPYIWSNGRACPQNGNVASAYPADWADCLPAGNTYAGQPQFFDNLNNEIWFPGVINRRPFLTKFYEPATNRTYMITSVHLPPTRAAQQTFNATPEGIPAWVALSTIANRIRELDPTAQAANGNQANVIVGDININIDFTQSREQLRFFTFALTSRGYVPVFSAGGNSMLTQVPQATPDNYDRGSLLDNCFVSYYPRINPATTPFPFDTLSGVIDRVAGCNIGGIEFPSLMYNSLQEINDLMDEDEQNLVFRSKRNYGHIAHFTGVSDHLPILTEI